MEMAEVARCHMARATVAACYNELCGAAAQTVERPRVYAIIPRIVEAFAAASKKGERQIGDDGGFLRRRERLRARRFVRRVRAPLFQLPQRLRAAETRDVVRG